MRTVEHQYRRARRLILRLPHHQIYVVEVERKFKAVARYGVEHRRRHVQVKRVAEFVGLRRFVGLDARRQIFCGVPPERRFAETGHQVLERLVAEKIYPLLRDLEFDVGLFVFPRLARPLLVVLTRAPRLAVLAQQSLKLFPVADGVQIAFLQQPLDQTVDQFFQPLVARIARFIEELVVLLLVEQAGIAQRLADRPPQAFERVVGVKIVELVIAPILRPPPVMAPELVIEAAAQKVIAEGLHQLIQADVVPTLARPFGISGESHITHGATETQRGRERERNRKSSAAAPPLSVSVALWLCGKAYVPKLCALV